MRQGPRGRRLALDAGALGGPRQVGEMSPAIVSTKRGEWWRKYSARRARSQDGRAPGVTTPSIAWLAMGLSRKDLVQTGRARRAGLRVLSPDAVPLHARLAEALKMCKLYP